MTSISNVASSGADLDGDSIADIVVGTTEVVSSQWRGFSYGFSGPALVVGNAFTVIVTSSVAVQPSPSVTVTEYVAVEVGKASGSSMFASLRSVPGVHE